MTKKKIIWRTVRYFVERKKDSGESKGDISSVSNNDSCAPLSLAEQISHKDKIT